MASAFALVVAACATGIAPADALGQDDQQEAPPAASDPMSGSSDTPDTGGSAPDAGQPPSPEASTPPPTPDAAPDTGPTTCTKTLTIPKLSLSNSGCTDINTKVTSAPATVTYPCAGGAASVTFGAQKFTGTVTGTTILVTNIEKFALKSCQFEGTQIISGDLASAPLAYSYAEKMLGGSCSGFIICKATGNVSVN